MNNTTAILSELSVKDVMNTDVITVEESDEMRAAALKIFEADISGVPVVDALGKCVGVLSARDFVTRDAGKNELQILTRTSPDAPYNIECLDDCLVQSHMSRLVATIAEDSSLAEAGRVMCDEGIHRLIVINERSRPVGVITSIDFVAAVVEMIE